MSENEETASSASGSSASPFVGYAPRAATSMQIFRGYIARREDPVTGRKVLDASRIVSPECFKEWLASRMTTPSNPEKAFQRALSSQLAGVDGRAPFTEEEEKAVLLVIRRKERWPCFHNTSVGGFHGYRSSGFHEKRAHANSLTKRMDEAAGKRGNQPAMSPEELEYSAKRVRREAVPVSLTLHHHQNAIPVIQAAPAALFYPNPYVSAAGIPPTMPSNVGASTAWGFPSVPIHAAPLPRALLPSSPLPSLIRLNRNDSDLSCSLSEEGQEMSSALQVPPQLATRTAPRRETGAASSAGKSPLEMSLREMLQRPECLVNPHDAVTSESSFTRFLPGFVLRAGDDLLMIYSSVLSAARMMLLQRGYVQHPKPEVAEELVQYFSELGPDELVVAYNVMGPTVQQRFLSRNQLARDHFGARVEEGSSLPLMDKSSAAKCIRAFAAAYGDPSTPYISTCNVYDRNGEAHPAHFTLHMYAESRVMILRARLIR